MDARAVWLTAPHQLELRTEELPAVGPGQVRVRALRSAISHGTEMLVYRGQVPADLPLDLPTLSGSFAFPIKYGYASVGAVEEVGRDVVGVHPGDLVFTHHPHQDRYVVSSTLPVPMPDGIDPDAAVFFANLETAVTIALDTPVRFGETVAMFGQGVVGLLVTMLLRRGSAGQVITVDPLPSRRARSLDAGADVVLTPEEDVPEQIRTLTAGRGADVVIEASGNPVALQQALRCAVVQGTVVVASWYGTKPVSLVLGDAFHRRRLRIISSQVGTLDPALAPRWTYERRRTLVISLLAELPLAGLVTHRVPFSRAADAYRLIDARPDEALQVLLDYKEG